MGHPLNSREHVVLATATLLQQAADESDIQQNYVHFEECPFSSTVVPDMPIEAYLERMGKYLRVGESVFVAAMIYLERILSRTQSQTTITKYSVHRLITVSLCLAGKIWEDIPPNNAYMSKVGAIDLYELNGLEQSFCQMVDYDFTIEPHEFDSFLQRMLQVVSKQQKLAEPSPACCKDTDCTTKQCMTIVDSFDHIQLCSGA